MDELDSRRDELTPEEREYSELLTVLIEAFEDTNYPLEGSTPRSRLTSLMEEHGLRQRDLLEVFGSRGIASEVVNGKRTISKAQAMKLAGLFHVPADLSFESRLAGEASLENAAELRATALTVGVQAASELENVWLLSLDTFRIFAGQNTARSNRHNSHVPKGSGQNSNIVQPAHTAWMLLECHFIFRARSMKAGTPWSHLSKGAIVDLIAAYHSGP